MLGYSNLELSSVGYVVINVQLVSNFSILLFVHDSYLFFYSLVFIIILYLLRWSFHGVKIINNKITTYN
jgi:hypothetical protein